MLNYDSLRGTDWLSYEMLGVLHPCPHIPADACVNSELQLPLASRDDHLTLKVGSIFHFHLSFGSTFSVSSSSSGILLFTTAGQ